MKISFTPAKAYTHMYSILTKKTIQNKILLIEQKPNRAGMWPITKRMKDIHLLSKFSPT